MGGFIAGGVGAVPDPLTVNGWTPVSGTGTVTGILSVTTRIDTDIIRARTAGGALSFQNQAGGANGNIGNNGNWNVAAGADMVVTGTNAGVHKSDNGVGLIRNNSNNGATAQAWRIGARAAFTTAGARALVVQHNMDVGSGTDLANFYGDGMFETLGGLAGPVGGAVRTAAYTITASDLLVRCDASGGAFTVTLPAAANRRQIVIIKAETATANAVTIAAGAGDTIDGAASVTLSTTRQVRILMSNGGTLWDIIGFSL